MGGDGGTISTQRKYVRGAKDGNDTVQTKANKREQQLQRTHECAQSNEVCRHTLSSICDGVFYLSRIFLLI